MKLKPARIALPVLANVLGVSTAHADVQKPDSLSVPGVGVVIKKGAGNAGSITAPNPNNSNNPANTSQANAKLCPGHPACPPGPFSPAEKTAAASGVPKGAEAASHVIPNKPTRPVPQSPIIAKTNGGASSADGNKVKPPPPRGGSEPTNPADPTK